MGDELRAQHGNWMYDVFLSFRGEDTRKNFTDHLYYALKDAGINVFRDDPELERGEDISSELERAIEGSKVAVIVFSENYAESGWCLEELVKIMECRRTLRQLVLPIFYNVDPSIVRKQKGGFEQAFVQHEERYFRDIDKVLRWRMALTEAANLSGWDLRNIADGHEAKFIRLIVEKISKEVNSKYLFVALFPVGIESRIQLLLSHLQIGSNDVRFVGILGMGGLGKTTIAKALYNHLYHNFEATCFLANIKQTSNQPNALIHLQQQLLSSITKSSNINLENVDRGITVLQERLRRKKLLLILDDVDEISQLNAIARSREWFGSGSRIVITTRDRHLLNQLEVDRVCSIDEMDDAEALELFSWHAFRNSYPLETFHQLSKRIVNYCGGLPLALEVLGSFLFGRSKQEWEDTLKKLKKIPDDQIQRKLRISFDGLNDHTYKDIFLDVSCFFIGMDRNYVEQILEGCGFFPRIGISVLLQRCLLTIGDKNRLMMHDLLRDMGREIVHENFPKYPEKHTRLFLHEEVLSVLTRQKGTDATEGLSLKLPRFSKQKLSTKAFNEMQNLRLLQLNFVNITGDFKHISQEIRWICWHGFPLKFLPKDFHMVKLVAMDLRYSQITFFWKECKGWTVSGFGGVCLPGKEIPDWFAYKDEGHSIFLEMPQFTNCNLEGFIVCTLYSSCFANTVSTDLPSLSVINYTKGVITTNKPLTNDVIMSTQDHLWQGHLSNKTFKMEAGDEVEIIIDFGAEITVKKIGISLVFDKYVDQTMLEFGSTSNDDVDVVDNQDENIIENEGGVGSKRDFDNDDEGLKNLYQMPKRLKYEINSEMKIDEE